MSFRLSPLAVEDIEQITHHIATDSPRAARRWFDELHRSFEALGGMPAMGVERPQLGHGVRLMPFGRYVILYQPDRNGVLIVRVVHSARHTDSWL